MIKIIKLSRSQNEEARNRPFHPWQLLIVISSRIKEMKSQIICLHRTAPVSIIKSISVYKHHCKTTHFSSRTAFLVSESLRFFWVFLMYSQITSYETIGKKLFICNEELTRLSYTSIIIMN